MYMYIFIPCNDTQYMCVCVFIYVYVCIHTHSLKHTPSVYHYFWVHFGCAGNKNLKSTRTLVKLKKDYLYLCRKIGLLKASNHMLFFRYVILKTCLFWSQSHKVFQRMCIMTNGFLCVCVCGWCLCNRNVHPPPSGWGVHISVTKRCIMGHWSNALWPAREPS